MYLATASATRTALTMNEEGLKQAIMSLSDLSLADIQAMNLSGRLCADSRKVQSGDVFIAVKGTVVDGHDYISDAVGLGAALIIAQKEVESLGIPVVNVPDSAVALGILAQGAFGNPDRLMTTLGVTGTNGKTTVAYIVRALLKGLSRNCGMLGTVEYDLGDEIIVAGNTMPDAIGIASMTRRMLGNNIDSVIMECSSHGLDQRRQTGLEFDAAAFTNLTGDHLDYHGTKDKYLRAKGRLFDSLGKDSIAILNSHDPASRSLAIGIDAHIWWYGIDNDSDIAADIKGMTLVGTCLTLGLLDSQIDIVLPLVGEHNVHNFLAAVGLVTAVCMKDHIDASDILPGIAEAIKGFDGIPGRLERVDCGQDFTVLVDYAHTDDALDHVLMTLKGLSPSRITVVFGCGGGRDKTKRPRMAAVADRWADSIIVTDDNPRFEESKDILADIRQGFASDKLSKVVELPDRREAIEFALAEAKSGQVVLIAGKGHEDYQLVAGERLEFDDCKVVREYLNNKK